MTRLRRTSIVTLTMTSVLVGCERAEVTDPMGDVGPEESVGQSLQFTFPRLGQGTLGRFVVAKDLGGEPVRTEENVDSIRDANPFASITNAQTGPGFEPGAAYAYGVHTYTGNVSTIATTAIAAFQCPHRGGCEPLAFRRSKGPCNLVACDTIGSERTRSAT